MVVCDGDVCGWFCVVVFDGDLVVVCVDGVVGDYVVGGG